jgi:hypothetical protein
MDRTALVLLSRTAEAPAVLERSSVQRLGTPTVKRVGEQLMDVGVAGIARLSVVVAEALFRVAVRVAVWLEASAAVVAEKVPVDDPAASAIEAGTFRALDVFVSVTVTPFEGAA